MSSIDTIVGQFVRQLNIRLGDEHKAMRLFLEQIARLQHVTGVDPEIDAQHLNKIRATALDILLTLRESGDNPEPHIKTQIDLRGKP